MGAGITDGEETVVGESGRVLPQVPSSGVLNAQMDKANSATNGGVRGADSAPSPSLSTSHPGL